MWYIEEIKKITPIGWLLLAVIFSFSIAAGVVFLFAFRYSTFENLSDLKLLLLSLSLTLPINSFNTIIYFFASRLISKRNITASKYLLLLHFCIVNILSSFIYFLPVIWKIIGISRSAISGYRNMFSLEIAFIFAMVLIRLTTKNTSCGEKTDSKKT